MPTDFRETVREGERKGEKHQSVASCTEPNADRTRNSGLCPEQESNQRPFNCMG